MKWFVLLFVLLLLGTGIYAYQNNPDGCARLGSDLKADLPGIAADVVTIFTSDKAAPETKTPKTAPSSTNGAPTPDGALPKAAPSSTDATPAAPGAGASDASPETAAAAPAASGWTPPTTIPSQPDWTWTTSQGTFNWVHIVKVEADRVTILHMHGQAVVPISELPPDLQKQLNYDPAAAIAASTERKKKEGSAVAQQEAQPAMTAQPALAQAMPKFTETTNYADALAEAKRTKRKVLLHFTGSDWCYYCKMLDQEVLSRSDFRQFAEANYITVTLDFPHETPIAPEVKQQNQELAQKFSVTGYPTLLVLNSDEKELGRLSGYNPGSGPSAVIDGLKPFTQ